MGTQVFISWSGDLSKMLAETVREWLPATLQFVKPYFTPVDIEKGTKWGAEISAELERSDTGIICLTRENLSSPWILFEAGALSKKPRSRVCTLLFNVEPTDVKGPLTLFQHTRFVKEDFKGLVETINNAGGESKLEKSVFDRVFEMWWPKLEEQTAEILRKYTPAVTGEPRKERDILEELLELTRVHVQRDEFRDQQPLNLQLDRIFDRAGVHLDPSESYTVSWDTSHPKARIVNLPTSPPRVLPRVPPKVPPSSSPEPSPSPESSEEA